MTKTEAAEILADAIAVYCIKNDLDDSELTGTMIAEAISRARYQTAEGSYLYVAGWLRPSDRTVRTAYKRRAGLL